MKRLFSVLRAVCVALFCIMVPLSAFSLSCAEFCTDCGESEKCEQSLKGHCNCPNGVNSVKLCTVDADSYNRGCDYYYEGGFFGNTVVPSCTCETVSYCWARAYYYEAAGCREIIVWCMMLRERKKFV